MHRQPSEGATAKAATSLWRGAARATAGRPLRRTGVRRQRTRVRHARDGSRVVRLAGVWRVWIRVADWGLTREEPGSDGRRVQSASSA
jgi:hypothetical protein